MNAAGNFMLVVASTQGIVAATDSESHRNEAGNEIIAMIDSGVVCFLLQ